MVSHLHNPQRQMSTGTGMVTSLKIATFNCSKLSLTKGSAMTIRILRSEMVVKLAKRLLSTYSPGRLSGSTLMGIMAGGLFSPCEQQTCGTGGLLYPVEALDEKKRINNINIINKCCTWKWGLKYCMCCICLFQKRQNGKSALFQNKSHGLSSVPV